MSCRVTNCDHTADKTILSCLNPMSMSFVSSRPSSKFAINSFSHRRHRQGKTVLSCPRRRCQQNWRRDKTVLSCHVGGVNTTETRQEIFVSSPIVFTPPTRTRQNCLGFDCVGGVNKLQGIIQTMYDYRYYYKAASLS